MATTTDSPPPRVEAIHIAPAAGAPMVSLDRAVAIAGRGIEGDRYAAGLGHWSAIARRGDGLTLIEAEALSAVGAEVGIPFAPGETRRNVTTRGIRLDGLLGRQFRIGDVVLRVIRPCEPCSYLDEVLGRDVLPVLVHRGGIRVEIVSGGGFAVGDEIVPLE